MSSLRAPLLLSEDRSEFRALMSAHEAGHVTVGLALGARVEAVYAVIREKLPNGNFSICYLTKFGSLPKRGLGLEEQILLTAGGAAGERMLNGTWDEKNAALDRKDLQSLGAVNFDYCVAHASRLLQQNDALLAAVRDKIKTQMSDLKNCKLTKKGSHIILAKDSELQNLFRNLGISLDSSGFDLNIARLRG